MLSGLRRLTPTVYVCDVNMTRHLRLTARNQYSWRLRNNHSTSINSPYLLNQIYYYHYLAGYLRFKWCICWHILYITVDVIIKQLWVAYGLTLETLITRSNYL